MIERLDMEESFSTIETAIHLSRYNISKPYCKGKRVLDISCGEGYGSKRLKEFGAKSVVGVDISETAISKAKKYFSGESIKFIVDNAEQLSSLKDNSFDLIVSYETIEHLKNPESFLNQLKRVGTSDCIIIVSCPNDFYYYPKSSQKNPYHQKKYTFEQFSKLFESVFSKNVSYLIGTRLNGYLNNFVEKNLAGLKMSDMNNVTRNVDCEKVFNDIKDIKNESNYYVAIYNSNNIKESACIYYEQVNKELKDIENQLRESVSELEISREELIDSYNAKSDYINQIEKEKYRLETINKIVLAENTEYELGNIYHNKYLETENKRLSEECAHMHCEYNYVFSEYQKIEERYNTVLQDKSNIEEKYKQIIYSRTYKLSNKISRIARKIWKKN